MRPITIIWLLLFLLPGSCIEPVELVDLENDEHIVVEGWVTNESRPYTVRISKNTSLLDNRSKPVNYASVTIRDDLDNEFMAYQTGEGTYMTRAAEFTADTGRTYILDIRLHHRHYQSSPQRMLPPVEIRRMYFEYKIWDEYNSRLGRTVKKRGFHTYIDFQDPEGENNYYLWKNSGIIEIMTLMYSGGIPPPDWTTLCWQNIPSATDHINISDDRIFNGTMVTKHKVATIYNHNPFRYQITVEQHTINEETCRFWNSMKNQVERRGSLFDPTPARITGNIVNTEDPAELVFGYFMVSSVDTARVMINRSCYFNPNRNPLLEVNCLSYPNTTDVRPPGF